MAPQTKANPLDDPVGTATERVAEFNEKVLELNQKAATNGRKAGAAYLSSYEKAVVSFADSYERAAGATKVGWVSDLATAQAEIARDVARASTAAVGEFLS
jgi:hypothetical protein